MAAVGDTFLSDVHLYTPFERSNDVTGKAFTRFCIRSPQQQIMEEIEKVISTSPHSTSVGETDSDGDLVLPRHHVRKEISDVITIEHHISTILQDVGLQVWRGALLLCDFLVHNTDRFDGCSALELGAGVGLCSIVLGRVARRVICTDVGEGVLENCLVNVMNNAHICKHPPEDSVIKVRQLDWRAPELSTDKKGIFHWSEADKEELQNIEYIFAADVVYDDQITDGFFQVVANLFKTGSHKVLYLSLEKRLNFTVDDLDMACPAYEHFLSVLESLAAKDESIIFRRVATNFPQYLSYERVKELELWEIQPS